MIQKISFKNDVRKVGASLYVLIPMNIINSESISEGDEVQIFINKIDKVIMAKICNGCGSENYITQSDVEQGFFDCRVCQEMIKIRDES